MSAFFENIVCRVPSRSLANLVEYGENIARQICPDVADGPAFVDLRRFEGVGVKVTFKDVGRVDVVVYPATREEIGSDREAFAMPTKWPDAIPLVMLEAEVDRLLRGGKVANRPRATLAHELGHAFCHVPIVAQHLIADPVAFLNRNLVPSTRLKAHQNAEWQAWGFGGSLVMPLCALRRMSYRTPSTVATEFRVSEDFARAHLRLLHRNGVLESDHIY